MKKFIALVLMLSVFFTTTLSAATRSRVIENQTTCEYVIQEQPQPPAQSDELSAAKKHAIIDFVGTLILGELGFHQFYNHQIGLGIVYLFTGGLLGIGYIYSIIITLINVVEICC